VPARPIRTLHLDDLVLLLAKCLSGFTHFFTFTKRHVGSNIQHALDDVVCNICLALVGGALIAAVAAFVATTLESWLGATTQGKVGRCRLNLSVPS